ncbi:VCBS repeat-containing protein [filamentous cyanobacterium LEGE 11480]|uniref:VCBS repeat-containing protein n=1 Tax=Romeriopsis navalis LEGE 11480 TaxID=2777977 RepID=A0A928VQW2_9CYAN|nr:VCBS repeat-containing protein [Romeriopsis navalis]MBE9032850.1 VCBS repeat-containing protein [Romeriopsis navalis LEGE 11480]
MLNLKPFGASEFDFNGDRRADFIDTVAGEPNVFVQADSGIFRARALSAPSPDPGWNLVGVGDFDGDGTNDDLYWRHRLSSKTAIDLVDAGQVGDGTTDIFWRYIGDDAASEIWFMKNGEIAESLPLPIVPQSWASQIADFNSDGKADIFWQDSATGQLEVWLLDGATLLDLQRIELPGSRGDLKLVDINGDGRTDVFDRERFTGRSRVWFWGESGLQDAATPVELPATAPDGAFNFGDFNGDQRADILFRGPAANTAELFIGNADGKFDTAILTGLENRYFERIQDFDGDGKTDLMVTNFLSRDTQLLLLDGPVVRETKLSGRVIEPVAVPLDSVAPSPSAATPIAIPGFDNRISGPSVEVASLTPPAAQIPLSVLIPSPKQVLDLVVSQAM